MSYAIVITLMLFAAIGSVGAGVAFAVGRARELSECELDVAMRAVTLLLFCFGAACAFVAIDVIGVLAFGGVISWFSYVLAAQRLGVFRILDRQVDTEFASERRRIA